MLKELEDLGLSEKEAKVYLASLEIGRATADQLAKQAKIVRSTTYVQIESLMKKGLMSTYEEGKKTYFAPESPELLKRLLLQQKEALHTKETELTTLLPTLMQQFEGAGERPLVRFFAGKEGITAMREETLSLKEGEEIQIIFSFDSLSHIYTFQELDAYTEKRVKKGIKVRYVYSREAGKLPSDKLFPLTSRRYISSQKMTLKSDFFIYRDKVAIMALGGPVFGFVVDSKEVADSFRSIFSLLWTLGEN